ncbi:MAG: POTRA domain-containing protein [Cloacibacillus sp.]
MVRRAKFLALLLISVIFVTTSAFAAQEDPADPSQGSVPSFPAGTVPPQSPAPVSAPAEAAVSEDLTGPVIVSMDIEGNSEVAKDHIMSVVTSKVGQHVDEEKLRKDAEAMFELGFFNATDYKVTDSGDGVKVTFMVQENPKVGEVKFIGNTIYPEDKLKAMIFTQPGMIFNRTFFRNDIQRIKEKYQADGYVMANIKDVKIDGDKITVEIIEPKISEIVIQGNKITKKKIVERYLKIKVGELFNSNKLRLTLNRLQGIGYFSDVNVNFEPGEEPEQVIVILTVEEARTGKLGFNVAYGTESGFGGGLSYENFNIGGLGLKLSVGFEVGDRSEYWLSFEQPYMSGKVMAWKIGAYKRTWDDIYYYENDKQYFEYDRDKYGAFIGFGKKFRDESKYNWYMLLDWHNTKNDNIRDQSGFNQDYPDPVKRAEKKKQILEEELGEGNYYSATLSFRRFNIDEYLPYTKGDVESLNFQFGKASVNDTDYNYMKYWLESKYFFPLGNFLKGIFETNLLDGYGDKPVLLAARVIVGSSTGDVPYDEMYTVGGDTTLRGYDDDYYRGQQMFLGNFELRIPIEKMFSFVFFYDIGRAWRTNRDNEPGFFSDMGSAPGVGVRINTPMGNLRLDYASGEEGRFHFGFGELF